MWGHIFLCGVIALLLLGGYAVAYFDNEHSRENKIYDIAYTKLEKERNGILKSCDQKIESEIQRINHSFEEKFKELCAEWQEIRSKIGLLKPENN